MGQLGPAHSSNQPEISTNDCPLQRSPAIDGDADVAAHRIHNCESSLGVASSHGIHERIPAVADTIGNEYIDRLLAAVPARPRHGCFTLRILPAEHRSVARMLYEQIDESSRTCLACDGQI